jgi:hypothetical protein
MDEVLWVDQLWKPDMLTFLDLCGQIGLYADFY